MALATSNLQDMMTKQIQKKELFSPKFVYSVLSQIANGLKTLHDAGIVHGNLKPSNILIFGTGDEMIVKLTDYEGFPGTSACHEPKLLSVASSLI